MLPCSQEFFAEILEVVLRGFISVGSVLSVVLRLETRVSQSVVTTVRLMQSHHHVLGSHLTPGQPGEV